MTLSGPRSITALSGALVARIPPGCTEADPLVIVPDVLTALTALGAAARARTMAKVVAVTGSVGKTSTKEMLRAVLSALGPTHAAEASYNNHWGVPLTLARMPSDAAFAVIEIGMNHPGEIAPLSRLTRPHIAVITTVTAAHLEAFDNIEGIAWEKAAIFEGLEPGGIAVLRSGLAVTPILRAAAERCAARTILFGTGPGDDYRLIDATLSHDTTVVRAERRGAPILFKVRSAGRHFAENALAVLAVAEALGADPAVTACDLGQWQPPKGRGQRETVASGHRGRGADLRPDRRRLQRQPRLDGRGTGCPRGRRTAGRRRAQGHRTPHRHSRRHAGTGADRGRPAPRHRPRIPPCPASIWCTASAPGCARCGTYCRATGAASGGRRRPILPPAPIFWPMRAT